MWWRRLKTSRRTVILVLSEGYVIRFPQRNVDYRKLHKLEVEDLFPYIPIKG
jgi:hypothetical protein